ncbi:MAG: hypothetical protein M1838_001789 [Thelocarpon superellum]|nr:MAG: hypothetical protein M1838_001789 [Thelocarpon superellum]
MTRAHSMPVVDGAGRVLLSTSAVRPSSPLTGGKRYRLPPRSSTDESIPSLTRYPLALEDAVPEDAELDMTPKARDRSLPPSSPLLPLHPGNTFPRRHRPSSPFRPVFLAPTSAARPSTPTSTSASPAVPLARFTETYPVNYSYQLSFSSNSSLPSTPTSARSRSPSISSLETIPDSPDAEEAALEAERIVQLKEAAEAAERGEAATTLDERRRSSFDPSGAGPSASGRSLLPGVLVSSYASRDKKKRWSVCGAERTGDLDLETIWED